MNAAQQQSDHRVVSNPVLKPVLDAKYALTWQQAAVVVLFVGLFLYVSHLPIHTPVWGRILSGEMILRTGRLPTSPPFVPLAAGRDVVAVSWLTDVLMAELHRFGGPLALAGFSALAALLMSLLWSFTIWSWSPRKCWLVAGFFLNVAAWWPGLPVQGTFYTEGLCLAVFGWLLLRRTGDFPVRENRTARLPAVVVLMAVWANTGISFPVGLAVLFFFFVEAIVDSATGAVAERAPFFQVILKIATSRSVQSSWWLFFVGVLSCCLTPNHIGIWPALFRTQANPIALEPGICSRLVLASFSGIVLTITLLTVLFAGRQCRPFSVAGILTVVAGAIVVAVNERLLALFVPLAVVFTARSSAAAADHEHGPELTSAERQPEPASEAEQKPLKFAWTLISALLIWCGFTLSPLGDPWLAATPRSAADLLSESTPIGATVYLAENPPVGLVWAPAEWADWLAVHGDRPMAVFTNRNIAYLPRYVQRDYADIFRGGHDWQRAADRYAVQTLVVDKTRQRRLEIELRKTSDWILRYEDAQAMVLTRRELP